MLSMKRLERERRFSNNRIESTNSG